MLAVTQLHTMSSNSCGHFGKLLRSSFLIPKIYLERRNRLNPFAGPWAYVTRLSHQIQGGLCASCG